LSEEELFRKALTTYYNAGKQSNIGFETSAAATDLPTLVGSKRVHSTEEMNGDSNLSTSVINQPLTIPSTSAATMAALMIQQQVLKKKKSAGNAVGKRTIKANKKDDKSGSISLSNAPDSLDSMSEKNAVKEKSMAPVVPVLPGFLAPPPIAANDIRRNLCKIIMNAFHSCDVKKLRDVLEQYGSGTDEIVEIHRYEGIQNPHGKNYSRYEGLENILQLWMALFKSAPDFCFELFNHKSSYDPDWMVIVSCEYTMVGTRIMDVRISLPNNAMPPCDANSGNYGNNISHPEREETDSPNSADTIEESLFSSVTRNELVVSNNKNCAVIQDVSAAQNARIFLDTTTTLKQPCQLRYRGKFQLFLNGFQKIYKIEFVYTAIEEAMIGIPAVSKPPTNTFTATPSINRSGPSYSIANNYGKKQ